MIKHGEEGISVVRHSPGALRRPLVSSSPRLLARTRPRAQGRAGAGHGVGPVKDTACGSLPNTPSPVLPRAESLGRWTAWATWPGRG